MANKEATVAELTEKFQSSSAVLLTEYRGLTVGAMKTLRRSISADATYAVAKNTLLKIAAKNAGVTAFDGQLAGPTAMAFVHGDPVNVAKLADLESREVLLAKAAGMFKASMFKAAYMFQAPLAQAVRTIDALRAKQETNA
jgi:large subunit ribosomal protein L10